MHSTLFTSTSTCTVHVTIHTHCTCTGLHSHLARVLPLDEPPVELVTVVVFKAYACNTEVILSFLAGMHVHNYTYRIFGDHETHRTDNAHTYHAITHIPGTELSWMGVIRALHRLLVRHSTNSAPRAAQLGGG